MRKLSSIVARALAVTALAVFTSTALPVAITAQPAPEHITVGASTDDLVRPLLYAVDAGLFKKAGLDVEIVKLANGAAVAAAVAGGSLDLGKGSALTPVQAYAKGIPFTVTANLGDYTADAPSIAMLVLKNSPLRGPKDLAGKTIGMVGLQDSITLGIYTWLEQNGVDIAAEKFVEIGNSAGAAALQAGRVDAMMFQEPALSAAISLPDLRVFAYPDNALGKRFSIGTIFGMSAWVNAHRDAVTRFNVALRDAEAYVGAHENETKPLAAKFAGVDVASMQNVRPPLRTLFVEPSDIQTQIDAAAKYKFIAKGFDANEFICDCALRKK
jgi:NitT/TauT family transport system substrate-binding protein